MWNLLNGKKRAIGIVLGGLLAIVYGLDGLLHDLPETAATTETAWLSDGTYTMLAGLIASWFGVAYGHAVKKSAKVAVYPPIYETSRTGLAEKRKPRK